MLAAARLSLPMLRAASPWWFWPLLAAWGALAGLTDDDNLGLVISVGGAVLLMLSLALGIHLRLCRSRSLAAVLPGFDRYGLAASMGILLGLVVVLASIDAWRADSLLALLTAAALGLGLGLGLPPAGIPLLVAIAFFVLGWGAAGLNVIWAGHWSPAAAIGALTLGLTIFRLRPGSRWLSRLNRAESEWNLASARDLKSRGRRPYQSGQLLGAWRLSLISLCTGIVLGLLAIADFNRGAIPTRLDPEMVQMLTYFLTLFAGAGAISTLLGLLITGKSMLRKLAVLPGWSREQLFRHAELSCWRCAYAALLTLGAGLLLISLWAGQFSAGLWLAASGLVGGFYLLGTYLVLWLMRVRSQALALAALLILMCPLLSVQWMVFSGARDHVSGMDGHALSLSSSTIVFVVSGAAALAWWLRYRARIAWRSIDFLRKT